jgi:hypothetical protein
MGVITYYYILLTVELADGHKRETETGTETETETDRHSYRGIEKLREFDRS